MTPRQDHGARALAAHRRYHGKIQVLPKCPVDDPADLNIWYTPGVAAVSRAIVDDPPAVDVFTNRANTVAVLSDGTRVLGLGDIGPRAALPVMEGKALLFKAYGAVDAVPICLDTTDLDELHRTVRLLEPSFGGINLEDIETPKCFRLLDALREDCRIPVWHDDQQGTATVVLAGLVNALSVVGKRLDDVRIALVGVGAANVASYRLLRAAGVASEQFVACDSSGILRPDRADISNRREELAEKWALCSDTNPDGLRGGIAEALRGADVCLAFSASTAGLIDPQWVSAMARDAIVFACANPTPEIWPDDARAAGAAVVATGRGDFANQVNNSLGFPGIFRGVLDVGAVTISDGMAIAAAQALAARGRELGLAADHILPTMADWELPAHVAAAVGAAAVDEGLARRPDDVDVLFTSARRRIEQARRVARAAVLAGDLGESLVG